VIIVKTPLRISLLGGGTDFPDFYEEHGGAVLSTAINKSVYIVLKERFDDMIYLNYSKKEIVSRVDDIEHDLIREAMKLTGVDKGVEITTLSDVPDGGTGLGTSSSVTVGLLQALYAHQHESVGRKWLAEDACEVEIDRLGKPIGKQDQYIAAYGGFRHIVFSTGGVEAVGAGLSDQTLQELRERLLVYYTGVTRQVGDILEEQRDKIPVHTSELLSMSALVDEGLSCLLSGNLDYFGEILNENWRLKRRLASGVSTTRINNIYDYAQRAGATGGKLLGAGGGGFLLLYVPIQARDAVRVAMAAQGLGEFPFSFSQDGSEVIFRYRG